jgi:uncharacterized protein
MQNKPTVKDFVINMLEEKLPASYCYHNAEHTLYVTGKVAEIGGQENCTAEEISLLTVAALWHDAGYINTYTGHEEEGCKLARQYLPSYGFSTAEINKICGMIMATKIPQSPKNKLEEIIADADLEYLGTESAEIKADSFFRELHYLNPLFTNDQWNQQQILFLQQHSYFTTFCKENKEPAKLTYLKKLLNGSK